MHKTGVDFVTLGENQKILICLSISSDVLPRMAEQGFTSHGRLVECRSRHDLFYLNQAYLAFLIFGQRSKAEPVLCSLTVKNGKTPFKTRIFIFLDLPC